MRQIPHPGPRLARDPWARGLAAAGCLCLCLAGGATPVRAQDSDGDGLTDAEEISRVRTAPFGPQQVITTAADGAGSVFAADLDRDGDPDVLSASNDDDTIAWYENRLDEQGLDFGRQQVITSTAYGANSVFAADLDGDGDPDVLSASFDAGIHWYENRLGAGGADFGEQQVIGTVAYGATSVFAADLDGDGDSDVLSASSIDDKIAWYENPLIGEIPYFPAHAITTAADGANSVFAADLDGDGDSEVLASSVSDDTLAWHENRLDQASADFGLQRVISTAADGAKSAFALDLDGDGDPDVLSASYRDDTIAWYENPGTNPLDPDTDGDGLSDGDEVNLHATDPIAPDSDGDGLSDSEEVNVHGTDPNDPDSDGDGLSDDAELDVYATNPLASDSDGDGFDDRREVRAGSDPNDANSTPPPPGFAPSLFQTSFIIHAFGNDVTTGTTDPFNTDVFFAMPLGTNCRDGRSWTWTPSYSDTTPAPYYCHKTTRQRGQPATGRGLLGIRGQSPASLWLSPSAFDVTAMGFLPSGYPYLQSHTYATFANGPGSFFAGGGPAAGKGIHSHKGGGQRAGRWIIREGSSGFGGALGLLGKLGATGKWVVTGKVGTYEGGASWNMVPALGRSQYATPIGTFMGKATRWQNPYTNTGMYTNNVNSNQSTPELRGTGTPWTTGSVTLYATQGFFTTILHRAGYDDRTPLGSGRIQLVTPALTHWIGDRRPDDHTGHIGILTLEVVPEPGKIALLAIGLGTLIALRRWGRRR